ncbi:MAG: tRNA (adenosine(37)-N6)-threonylcarbamoyltransferase complex dimerization subunit type 1 TsaB [Gammaproteobacteria bacterium]|nr:tRNA (adenosine(37)-N6)-threonylcarbamoyltransferase complex dimerization subunit type 1 TsaB [Gammaproteobacteria bacterium]|tara:strand:+ start:360 stop:1055 length:696 start_codon:yes stop_codon:yes gene_type:complete
MTNLLAIDTSSSVCAVALARGEEYFVRLSTHRREHAQRILPMIEEIVIESGVKLAELDTVAVNAGPGSFTGLRIGIGVVQGIASANELPVIPVSALALTAMSAKAQLDVDALMVCLKARDNEVYFASYQSCQEIGVVLIGEEQVCAPDSVCFDSTSSSGKVWYGIGDGWEYRSELERRLGFELAGIHTNLTVNISDLCRLAAYRYAKGLGVDPAQALPNYLKEQLDYLPAT